MVDDQLADTLVSQSDVARQDVGRYAARRCPKAEVPPFVASTVYMNHPRQYRGGVLPHPPAFGIGERPNVNAYPQLGPQALEVSIASHAIHREGTVDGTCVRAADMIARS